MTTTHTVSPVSAIPDRTDHGLPGFEATCTTCGLVIRNTVASNVEAEVIDHLAYWTARA